MTTTTEVLDAAKRHFAESQKLHALHVEEWGVTVYYPEALNCEESDRVIATMQKGTLAGQIEIIIQGVRDENGRRLFKSSHREVLLREVDRRVIVKLVDALMPSVSPLLEHEDTA